jgi:hypothetical protein
MPYSSYSSSEETMTMREILNATRVYLYQEPDPVICSISHTDIVNGDIVCEINACHHFFKYTELMTWLSNHNTCPVCRCNVMREEENEDSFTSSAQQAGAQQAGSQQAGSQQAGAQQAGAQQAGAQQAGSQQERSTLFSNMQQPRTQHNGQQHVDNLQQLLRTFLTGLDGGVQTEISFL